MNILLLIAAVVTLEWTMPNGTIETEKRTLKELGNRVEELVVTRAEVAAKGANELRVRPECAWAKKGEPGYWLSANGPYGTFKADNGRAEEDYNRMPFFGFKSPRTAYVAIVTGMPYDFWMTVEATNGLYRQSAVWRARELHDMYEDIRVEFHFLWQALTDHVEMAKTYRNYVFKKEKGLKPLRERVKGNPTLAYMTDAMEIRIRQAWKPAPSDLPNQTKTDEPEPHYAVTFDRVKDIVDALKRGGVDKAELCLVGWNYKGHDGRWPQWFPVEPGLGGEAKLREAIRYAQDHGYQIVPHGNFTGAYLVSDDWDAEYVLQDAAGAPYSRSKVFWSSGKAYYICPRRGYEKFATKRPWEVAGLGFKGAGFIDVLSSFPPCRCDDPRHPVRPLDCVKYQRMMLNEVRKALGGAQSEAAYDHVAPVLDGVFYVTTDSPTAAKFIEPKDFSDGHLPIWQIVYHGTILSQPFACTVNFTNLPKDLFLKVIEFGGRPCYYFYKSFTKFGTPFNTARAATDCLSGTDEELAATVRSIRRGYDIYEQLKYLQFETIEHHGEFAKGVWVTGYSDGSETVCNYRKEPFVYRGRTVGAEDWLLIRPVNVGQVKEVNWWFRRFAQKTKEIAAIGPEVDLVLMGDSITHGWDNQPPLARLKKTYPRTLTLGFNGDVVRNLRWRVANGELDGYRAKKIAVMIGTNDLGGGNRKPEVVFPEMKSLLAEIRAKQPEAEIILQAVLPRDCGKRETPWLWPTRIIAYNKLLETLADGEKVKFVDYHEHFLNADGSLKAELFFDRLHPNSKGYEIWVDRLTSR